MNDQLPNGKQLYWHQLSEGRGQVSRAVKKIQIVKMENKDLHGICLDLVNAYGSVPHYLLLLLHWTSSPSRQPHIQERSWLNLLTSNLKTRLGKSSCKHGLSTQIQRILHFFTYFFRSLVTCSLKCHQFPTPCVNEKKTLYVSRSNVCATDIRPLQLVYFTWE